MSLMDFRPVEKQYKVETKYMGERGVPGGPTQLLGTEEREVRCVTHVHVGS